MTGTLVNDTVTTTTSTDSNILDAVVIGAGLTGLTAAYELAVRSPNPAEKVMALGDELVERAMAETGLPEARIRGERGRTCGQLNLFADVAEEE